MAAMQNYAMLNGGVGLIPGQVPVIPPIPGAPGIQLPVTAMPPLPTVAAPLPPPVPVAVMPPLPTAPLPPAQPQVDEGTGLGGTAVSQLIFADRHNRVQDRYFCARFQAGRDADSW
uniref:Uncharacterized protein n=1 Tax=Lygus hesperus TaxID=30085 RepID=A0A0A9W3H9_LYGHE